MIRPRCVWCEHYKDKLSGPADGTAEYFLPNCENGTDAMLCPFFSMSFWGSIRAMFARDES